jgi:hypothetical protein
MKKLIILVLILIIAAPVFGRFPMIPNPPHRPINPGKPPGLPDPPPDLKCRKVSRCVYVDCPDWYVKMDRYCNNTATKPRRRKASPRKSGKSKDVLWF